MYILVCVRACARACIQLSMYNCTLTAENSPNVTREKRCIYNAEILGLYSIIHVHVYILYSITLLYMYICVHICAYARIQLRMYIDNS